MNTKHNTVLSLSALAIMVALPLTPTTALAQKLNMNPGMWETTTTMKSDMLGTKTKTTKECMSEDQFDPEKVSKQMLEGMPNGDCDTQQDFEGESMLLNMSCKMDGGSLNATGSWTFSGDEGSGNLKMNMEMQGMKVSMEMESTGRRVGDC